MGLSSTPMPGQAAAQTTTVSPLPQTQQPMDIGDDTNDVKPNIYEHQIPAPSAGPSGHQTDNQVNHHLRD